MHEKCSTTIAGGVKTRFSNYFQANCWGQSARQTNHKCIPPTCAHRYPQIFIQIHSMQRHKLRLAFLIQL